MNNSQNSVFELIEENNILKEKYNSLLETIAHEKHVNQLVLENAIGNANKISISVLDRNFCYLYFNNYHNDFMKLAYEASINLGKNQLEYISLESDRIKAKTNLEIALEGESHITIQEFGEFDRRYWETRYEPLKNDFDEFIGVTLFSIDISEKKKTEIFLKENAKRFKIAIDNFPYEFVILDPDFIILYLNKKALIRYSKALSELTGKKINDIDEPEVVQQSLSIQSEIIGSLKPISKNIETGVAEYKQFFKYTFVPVIDENGQIKEIFRISIDLTGIKTTENQLRVLSNQMEKMREDERQRISRDIHDDLGQILTVLKMDLASLKKHSAVTDALPGLLDPILGLVDSAIDSARRVSFELRPGILDQTGLVPAMEWSVNQLKNRHQIEFNLIFPENILFKIDIDKSVTVYRIFQEIMTNISRHSKATKVNVNLKIEKHFLILEVSDNGDGFILETHSESLGLLGMKERARIQNATLDVKSGIEAGTTITLKLPL